MPPQARYLRVQELNAHAGGSVNCVTLGRHTQGVMVTGGDDRNVNVWTIGRETMVMSLQGHQSAVESVTLDSKEQFVAAGASSGAIKVFDLNSACLSHALPGHKCHVRCMSFTSKTLASGSNDTNVKVWDLRTRREVVTIKSHVHPVLRVQISPDTNLVGSGDQEGCVKVYDVRAGRMVHEFCQHTHPITGLEFHPKEMLMATSSMDKTVKVWDLDANALLSSTPAEATGVRAMTFHHATPVVLAALQDGLRVWDMEGGGNPMQHDSVEVPWTKVHDIAVMHDKPDKLIACSFHNSFVGVWVVHLSEVKPWCQPNNGAVRGSGHIRTPSPAVAYPPVPTVSPVWPHPDPAAVGPLLRNMPQAALQAARAGPAAKAWPPQPGMPGANVLSWDVPMPVSSGVGAGSGGGGRAASPGAAAMQQQQPDGMTNFNLQLHIEEERYREVMQQRARAGGIAPALPARYNPAAYTDTEYQGYPQASPAQPEAPAQLTPVMYPQKQQPQAMQQRVSPLPRAPSPSAAPLHAGLGLVPAGMVAVNAAGQQAVVPAPQAAGRPRSRESRGSDSGAGMPGVPPLPPQPAVQVLEPQVVRPAKMVSVATGVGDSLLRANEPGALRQPAQQAAIAVQTTLPPAPAPWQPGPSAGISNGGYAAPSQAGIQAAPQGAGSNGGGVAAVRSESEILTELIRGSDAAYSLMSQRQATLATLRALLRKGDLRGALVAARRCSDPMPAADMLGALMKRRGFGDMMKLDEVPELVPVLEAILSMPTEKHRMVAVDLGLVLAKSFGPTIRDVCSSTATTRNFVDMAYEQRKAKCETACLVLQGLRAKLSMVMHMQQQQGGAAVLLARMSELSEALAQLEPAGT